MLIEEAFQTQKYGNLSKRQTNDMNTIPVIEERVQSMGEKFLHETQSTQSAYRQRDRIFSMAPVDLTKLSDNSSQQWKRHNATAGMPRVRMTTIPQSRTNLQNLTGPANPEFVFDAVTVTGEIVNFENRLGTANPKHYKYPNIELSRCYDPRRFKESNNLINNKLSSQRSSRVSDYNNTGITYTRGGFGSKKSSIQSNNEYTPIPPESTYE